MTDAIRELFELLTKKEKSGSDYTGTVTRVDGKTAYVQFDGSDITDTPVALSIGAKAGDSVRIRVADGRAWIVGNDDAPPNDSSEVGYELALTNALIRQLTTEQINGENGWINLLLGTFNYGNKLIWNGRELTVVGVFTAGAGSKIGPWLIGSDRIYKSVVVNGYEYQPILHAPDTITGNTRAFTVAVRPVGGAWTYPFEVKYDGSLTATKGAIGGWDISADGFVKTSSGAYIYRTGLGYRSGSGANAYGASVASTLMAVWFGANNLLEATKYTQIDPDGISTTGTFKEGGTALSAKYMGIVTDGNYYGMRIGNSDGAWVRTTSLGLIPYQAGGASSLGTSGWPFASVYATTIYEGGTALSNKYAPKSSSDIRLKENVDECEVDSALEVIDRIKLHSFDWRKDGKHQQIGFVADELEEIDERLADGGGYDADGEMIIKSVDTFYLQGYEVKAIQELHAEVKSLKAEIAELKEIIAVLMEGKK